MGSSHLSVSCFRTVMSMPWIPFYYFLRSRDLPTHYFLSVSWEQEGDCKTPKAQGKGQHADGGILPSPPATQQQLWHRPHLLSATQPSSVMCILMLPWNKSKLYKMGIKWDLSQTCHLGSLLAFSCPLQRTDLREEIMQEHLHRESCSRTVGESKPSCVWFLLSCVSRSASEISMGCDLCC